MMILKLKVSDSMDRRFDRLSDYLDRKKSYLIKQALETFLEEYECELIFPMHLTHKEKEFVYKNMEEEFGLNI